MSDQDDLRTQYTDLSYDQLENIRDNGVLSSDARAILLEVMNAKENEPPSEKRAESLERMSRARETGDLSELTPVEIDALASKILLTTETAPVGINISRRLEIVTAECVYGMNLFDDLFMAVLDVVGGRSGVAQKALREARKAVLAELKREALIVGADAVVAVALDYSEISGGGKSQILMIVASGTAVVLAGDDR